MTFRPVIRTETLCRGFWPGRGNVQKGERIMRSHKEIAEEILGYPIREDGCAPCPGAALHTAQSGPRDWRIWFDGEGKPHEYCFHNSCQGARDDFMRVLYRAISAEERGTRGTRKPTPKYQRPLPATPKARKVQAEALNEDLALALAARVEEEITFDWLKSHSPVEIPDNNRACGELLLNELYPTGSRILVFTAFASQGQYMYVVGDGAYKLGRKPGVEPVKAPRLPAGGDSGVWYLTAPITGKWEPNPGKRDAMGNLMPGRRHAACCTSFPYLVLESDVLTADVWLKILVQLADPIVAVYTSGGKSVHALVKVSAATPEEFNAIKAEYVLRLSSVGADAAAITPVRLSRLPGCMRHGATGENGTYFKYDKPRLQELLYLNPAAVPGEPILTMPARKTRKAAQ